MLFALAAGVFRYVDQHFYTPETFLENTSSLADDAEIRERLFEGFRTELIALAEGPALAEADSEEPASGGGLGGLLGADPDEDDTTGGEETFSDPVTEERIARDQAIEEILLDTFDSELYQEVFVTSLASVQQQIVRSAELGSAALLRDKGEITFDMRRLYPTIYERLAADERTAEITQNEVPAEYGIFPVADRDTTTSWLWSLVRKGPGLRSTMLAAAVLSLIGAVVIADRRPSTAIQFGGGMLGVGVVVIVVIYLVRFIVPLLAGGGSSAGPVVATYAANLWPLVRIMIRMVILGGVLAAGGWVARLIWPDDWVYSSVSDDRGVRSIMRRRGEPEPEQQQPAAAVPVGYPGYPQPYGYPPQWGQPYPGQPYPGYPTPYPVGPYAQPAQPLPQHYSGAGRPTVPVMPVGAGSNPTVSDDLVPPAAPPLDDDVSDDLPSDAAGMVPRVVATTGSAETTTEAADSSERDTVGPGSGGSQTNGSEPGDGAATAPTRAADSIEADGADDWATEPDW